MIHYSCKIFPFIFFFILILAACSRNQDQIEFEREAFREPKSFTRTGPDGTIEDEDVGDWQIGPDFKGLVEVQKPPYPNPTQGERLIFELYVTGLGIVNGIRTVTYDDFPSERSRRVIYQHHDSRLPFGTLVLDIYPSSFDIQGSYSAARDRNGGLHRLFIYDNHDNLITYGDIQLK